MGDEGFLRPELEILPESSLVPPESLVQPPPEHFTHEVRRDAPFRYASERGAGAPHGTLRAGTKVVLLADDGARARVVDGQGLHVVIDSRALRPLV